MKENFFYMPEVAYVWRNEHFKRRLLLSFDPPGGITSDNIQHSITMDGMQLIINYQPPMEFATANKMLAVFSKRDGKPMYSPDSSRSVALTEAIYKLKQTDPVDKRGSVPWYRMTYNLPF